VVGESVGADSTMMAGGVDGDTTRGDLLQAHFNYNCKRLRCCNHLRAQQGRGKTLVADFVAEVC
jgi:hypothetical protein